MAKTIFLSSYSNESMQMVKDNDMAAATSGLRLAQPDIATECEIEWKSFYLLTRISIIRIGSIDSRYAVWVQCSDV